MKLLRLWIVFLPLLAAAQNRVVAVGDIHGHCKQFEAVMERVGLIDHAGHWTGGDAVLVQTGDIVDKGPESRRCMDLIMSLELEAARQRGRVIALLGNHEAVNLVGQLHATAAEDYDQYAGPGSAERQAKEFSGYLAWRERRARRLNLPNPEWNALEKKDWFKKHPLGFFEHRDAYSPQGRYGAWIRRHNALAQVGEEIFLHAGLDPYLGFRNIGELNMTIHQEIIKFDALWPKLVELGIVWRYDKLRDATEAIAEELRIRRPADRELARGMEWVTHHSDWMLLSQVSPLWYPGFTHRRSHQGQVAFELTPTLARLHAKYVVMGHTPTPDGKIDPIFDERVFRIDTGMHVDEKPGHAAALEFKNGTITAFYADLPQEVLVKP